MRFLFIITLLCISIIGCSNHIDESLPPEAKLEFIEEFECWPDNIKKYSVQRFELDSLYKYPSQKYYIKNRYKYEDTLVKWKLPKDSLEFHFGQEYPEDCPQTTNMHQSGLQGNVYYSNIGYSIWLLLDVKEMILYEYRHNHIF